MSEHIGTDTQHGQPANPYPTGVVLPDTPARTLLNYLLVERGCGWDMLHRVTGVRIKNLRLWRGGEAPDPDAFAQLKEFGDFLDLLDTEVGYTQPTQATAFMETRITQNPGYHQRSLDLYLDGHRDLVLTLAYGGDDIDREHALDRATPGWREDRSDFEAYTDINGERYLARWRDRD